MAKRRRALEDMGLKGLFSGAYAGTRVLVTGHTGFKGSWLCLWLRALGAHVTGLALSPTSQPSHWDALALNDVGDLRIDLQAADSVCAALNAVRPQIVFHLAAQSLVRPSYRNPVGTFATNITGLVNLLEAIRAVGGVRALVNATTDKVYREPPANDGYSEDHPLGGHDPYSTSKACAELITDCYWRSYFAGPGPRTATARSGNVIGGGDWSEDRLVPDFIHAIAAGTPLRLRNPDAVRPWQHVLEPLAGYLKLGEVLLAGEGINGAWNFGPDPSSHLPVRELVRRLSTAWPGVRIETEAGPNPRESALLQLNSSKAAKTLGWLPLWGADAAIQHTVNWYRSYHRDGMVRSHSDLQIFIADARAAGLEWTR